MYDLSDEIVISSLATFFVLLATCLSIAIWDGEGRKDYQHVNPMPTGVTALDSQRFIIPDKTHIIAEQICGKGSPEYPAVTSQHKALDSTYVECEHSQMWDDHRAKSLSYFGAAGHFFTNAISLGIFGAAMFLAWLNTIVYVLKYNVGRIKDRRRKKRDAIDMEKARMIKAVDQQDTFTRLKGELINEWSKPDSVISDAQFEKKLAVLTSTYERGDL